ncbi:MAG: hypothetical protein HFF35_07030 [Oscillospiraceae bacterium]|nr:hypothetical protein [Oscillospiraceae bacterium]
MFTGALAVRVRGKDILHLLPSYLINQRRMVASVFYAFIRYYAFIVWIDEDSVQGFPVDWHRGDSRCGTGGKSAGGEMLCQIIRCPVSRGVFLKCQFNERGTFLVQNYRSFLAAFLVNAPNVKITQRCAAGGAAIFYFLVNSLFDFRGKIL